VKFVNQMLINTIGFYLKYKSLKPIIDTTWDINVEGKLNSNNIVFHTNKYQRLISKCKKYNNFIKKPKGYK